jgi:cation/acetate symporter
VIYTASTTAIVVFLLFVGFVLGISFYLGRKAKSAQGYFAAHGQIGWFVNGVAFAGDYLSAASFLGICGMIAFYGYDGFLYSIGYLAGLDRRAVRDRRADQAAGALHVRRSR